MFGMPTPDPCLLHFVCMVKETNMVAKYVIRNRESRQTLSRLHDYHEEHSVSLMICVPVIAHATATPAYFVLKVYS